MRTFFLICALLLLAAGSVTYLTQPEKQTQVPIIYWVIDPAPARPEQIDLFHEWLMKEGYGDTYEIQTMADLQVFRHHKWSENIREAIVANNPAGEKIFADDTTEADLPMTVVTPPVEMRLDSASNDLYKKLVQGVSRVAGDVIEAYSGGQQMQFLASGGMLADVTASAKEYGFTPDKTYKALAPSLFYEGKQYAFPRNVAQVMYWVNKESFHKYSQPLPPARWTIETFEERGKAYVEAANKGEARQQWFFADRAMKNELRRSLGLSMFNETLTTCTLDDPRSARVLALIHKWTYEDHILPSAADRASFDTEGGWGGQSFQLFKSGRYALFASGRWALMLFRKFGAMELGVVEPPYGVMPNTILSGGQSTVFAASKHRKYAELFLAYMASKSYNMQIVRSGDALPPNPVYTHTDEFLRPKEYPNEWGTHEMWANAARDIAVTQSFSPFVLPVTVMRYDRDAEDEVMNDRMTPEDAVRVLADQVNADIARTVRDSEKVRAKYEEYTALQERIDEARAAGRKVPAAWIKNPFHLRWYAFNGWLEDAEQK
jgi:multiple sugar transport system substrate-binding protein